MKLFVFKHFNGDAESIKLMLYHKNKHGRLSIEIDELSFQEFEVKQPEFGEHRMPILVIDSDITIGKASAIYRFLAFELGCYKSTEKEIVERVVDRVFAIYP